jgi:hypothetical protein
VRSLPILVWWQQLHTAKTLPLARLVVHWLAQKLAALFQVLALALALVLAPCLGFCKE